jgi:plasmid maintenance system antidote protein VapI
MMTVQTARRFFCVPGLQIKFKNVEEFMDYKREIRRCGMTQVEAAKKLGVSVPSLCQWINGYRSIPSDMEFKLQSLLHDARQNVLREWNVGEARA